MTKNLRDDELNDISGAAVQPQFDPRLEKIETSHPSPRPPAGGGPDVTDSETEHSGDSDAVLLP